MVLLWPFSPRTHGRSTEALLQLWSGQSASGEDLADIWQLDFGPTTGSSLKRWATLLEELPGRHLKVSVLRHARHSSSANRLPKNRQAFQCPCSPSSRPGALACVTSFLLLPPGINTRQYTLSSVLAISLLVVARRLLPRRQCAPSNHRPSHVKSRLNPSPSPSLGRQLARHPAQPSVSSPRFMTDAHHCILSQRMHGTGVG
jgi:hypothetical protein